MSFGLMSNGWVGFVVAADGLAFVVPMASFCLMDSVDFVRVVANQLLSDALDGVSIDIVAVEDIDNDRR